MTDQPIVTVSHSITTRAPVSIEHGVLHDNGDGTMRLVDRGHPIGHCHPGCSQWVQPAATCKEGLQVGAGVKQSLTAGAEEERDALLAALGWKTGPFPNEGTRKVVLDDCAGLRPEMVKARRRADDAEADRDIWRFIAGERVEEARSGLLLRVWNLMKDERRRRIKAEAANLWKPIDTAPKDGWHAPILTCRMGEPARWFGDEPVGGYAEPPEAAYWNEYGDCWTACHRPHDEWAPTHWMPMPTPPAEEPA